MAPSHPSSDGLYQIERKIVGMKEFNNGEVSKEMKLIRHFHTSLSEMKLNIREEVTDYA